MADRAPPETRGDRLSEVEYQLAQDQCALIGAMTLGLPDLEIMLRQIDHALAIGPILDPSLWMKANRKFERVRELVRAVRDLQLVARRHAVDELLQGDSDIEPRGLFHD